MGVVIIGLGSNLGDRQRYLSKAEELIANIDKTTINGLSSIYQTEPVGKVNQDCFLNQVMQIDTLLSPEELLAELKTIETVLGRERTIKWGPRTIDLDILFFDSFVVDQEDLVIPHSELHNRMFVLVPLNEIAPEFVHPVLNVSVSGLLVDLQSKIGDTQVVESYKESN